MSCSREPQLRWSWAFPMAFMGGLMGLHGRWGEDGQRVQCLELDSTRSGALLRVRVSASLPSSTVQGQ